MNTVFPPWWRAVHPARELTDEEFRNELLLVALHLPPPAGKVAGDSWNNFWDNFLRAGDAAADLIPSADGPFDGDKFRLRGKTTKHLPSKAYSLLRFLWDYTRQHPRPRHGGAWEIPWDDVTKEVWGEDKLAAGREPAVNALRGALAVIRAECEAAGCRFFLSLKNPRNPTVYVDFDRVI